MFAILNKKNIQVENKTDIEGNTQTGRWTKVSETSFDNTPKNERLEDLPQAFLLRLTGCFI